MCTTRATCRCPARILKGRSAQERSVRSLCRNRSQRTDPDPVSSEASLTKCQEDSVADRYRGMAPDRRSARDGGPPPSSGIEHRSVAQNSRSVHAPTAVEPDLAASDVERDVIAASSRRPRELELSPASGPERVAGRKHPGRRKVGEHRGRSVLLDASDKED